MDLILYEASTAGSQLNTALNTNVDPNNIVTQFVELMPWIGVMMIVSFTIYEARKLIKGGSKGKVRL